MAHTLNIVYGSTTIQLNAGDYSLAEYRPRYGDGLFVTETIKINISSATVAALQTAVNDIELAIRQAHDRYDSGIGDRVYLKFQPDSAAALYRSEITRPREGEQAGRIDPPSRILGGKWAALEGEFTLFITRRDYWEANAETELEIDNPNGTDQTGGLEISDPGATIANYVDIQAADIDGVLDTPIRLRLTNTYATGQLETTWIGLNHRSDPDNWDHILELEDSATGSNTADALASGGQYRQYTITTSAVKITYWTIAAAQIGYGASAYFRAIMRFFDGTDITNCKYKLEVDYGGGAVIWAGGWFQFDDTYEAISRIIREFDTVQIPPYKLEGGTPTALRLNLWAQSTTGSSETIKLDFLQLTPIDGWRKLTSRDGIAQNSILEDDGIEGIYFQEVSSANVRDIVAEGEPLYITPGKDHRIYFLMHSETANTAAIARTADIEIFYRPRIRTF